MWSAWLFNKSTWFTFAIVKNKSDIMSTRCPTALIIVGRIKRRVIIYLLNSLLSFIVLSGPVLAQNRISGQVKDDRGRPLGFASIYIENTIDGSTADSMGRYSFRTAGKGKQILVASFIGYETTRDSIIIDKKVITHDIIVKENAVAMQEVVITAGSYETSDNQKVAVLKLLDIYSNAGAGGDIMGAIRALPGAQTQSEETGDSQN
jgi:vitamin B12 transporter